MSTTAWVPDFRGLPLNAEGTGSIAGPDDWAKAVHESVGKDASELAWHTPEDIDVAALYTGQELAGVDFLHTWPGLPPYLRGPYPTMYTTQPWTIRQYAGLLHRRAVQRLLPPQSRRRPERPVGRLRPGDPPRLRQRPRAGQRRRRHGGRRDRLDLRHAPAVRRHPAGPDERLDDDERRGAADPRALRRRGRGAGGGA